jgi:hypothetical protein
VFRISFKLSSFKYSYESAGITISDVPRLNHNHNPAKNTHVVSSLGDDLQTLILFADSNIRRNMTPKV